MDSRRQTRVLIAHRHALVATGLAAALTDRSEILVVNLSSKGLVIPVGPSPTGQLPTS